MDIDRFLVRNSATWARLAELTTKARRSARKCSAAELGELMALYERSSAHLSYAQTHLGNPALVSRLTVLVADAGSVIHGTRPRSIRRLGEFFTLTFPAALWYSRRAIVISAALLLVPAFAMGLWISQTPEALNLTLDPALQDAYLNEDFENYYSEQPSQQFAAQVFTNNARIGLMAFALGIFLCAPTVAVLVFNGLNIGVAGGLFAYYGQLDKFFGLILPHGLLELSAIAVAGGAGLRLGWSVISPGDRSRSQSVAEEGQRSVVVAGGLVLVFLAAGLIEGFVTGKPWPTEIRVGIGVVAQAIFVFYIVYVGRRAVASGRTGSLAEVETARFGSAETQWKYETSA
jgi:uncharacterized membrane protein SpoIIM required for sporulation